MWNLKKLGHPQDCRNLLNAFEETTEVTSLSVAQQEHLALCRDCRRAADDMFMTRSLLEKMPLGATTPAPWFTQRVMSAISAKESELRQSLDAWAAVPHLAARLTWVSALALLLATTWLYRSPRPAQTSNPQTTAESLFDSPHSAAPDDVLPGMERGE